MDTHAPGPGNRVDPRRALGTLGEGYALAHFERLGFRALARNHRTRHGEIDLVVWDGTTIVFAEVKTRRRGGGPPLESVTPAKGRRVRRLAAAWLQETPQRPRARALRLDAVGVVVDAAGRLHCLEHLEGAF